jgi:hypothetical protein
MFNMLKFSEIWGLWDLQAKDKSSHPSKNSTLVSIAFDEYPFASTFASYMSASPSLRLRGQAAIATLDGHYEPTNMLESKKKHC